CTTDTAANVCFTGCTPPAPPSLALTPGNNQISVAWTVVGGLRYDLYRNEAGCSAGFVKIANDLTASPYVDTTVANGLTYYYQMIAHPTGNEACGSAASSCVNATPTACAPVAAPTGVAAAATAPNQITVSWNDSATGSVTSYDVLRAAVSGGPYVLVGNVPDGGAGPWSFQDNTVSGGLTYFYIVRANAPGGCQSPDSSQVSATATGECTLPPTFAGLQSVTNLGGGQGCGLRVAWNAATAQCGGAVTYAVYRSTAPGFTPGPANQLAACLSGTSFDDTTMPLDTSVYYVVRAEDGASIGAGPCNSGNVDANLVEDTGFASSTGMSGTIYGNDFEAVAGAPFFDWVAVDFGTTNDSWRGKQNCSGNIFRFGGTLTGGGTCTGTNPASRYAVSNVIGREPGNGNGITITVQSTAVRLTFQHRYEFEAGWDGGTIGVALDSVDPTTYTILPAAAILGGPALTTLNSYNVGAWTGTSTGYGSQTMQTTTIDLDAVCNVVTGASSGCAGQTVHVAWIGLSDNTIDRNGWYIDNVQLTRDPLPACTAAPSAVSFLTATGKDQQATVEWVNPAAGPFASTRLRTSTAAIPADPTAGTLLIDEPGAAGQKEAYLHVAGAGSNGVVQHYAAFANSGANVYSARRAVSGLPQATAGSWKWNFATPAAALAPPIQGRGLGVFVPSNDRAFYALAIGAAGGTWKSGFLPAAMNAPAQSSPVVMLAADTGLPHDATFLGSQDGHVYCFNAATGGGCSGWPAGGRSVASFGLVQAQPMFDPATDRILVGSRNAVGANGFHAINVLTGATAWSFTNSVPQGGNGQTMGMISGPALILGSRVVFASRTRSGGSPGSVWALDITAGSTSLAWRRDLGDIDGAPTHDWTSDRVIVGTSGGAVHALLPTTGATVWSRNFADGAIRSWIYYDPTSARLYFASSSSVRAIPASGATGSDWVVSGLTSPTRPILHFGTTRTYLGACADVACANGRVIELDAANSWATPKTVDLAGIGGLGPVTIDRSQNLLHAGSRSGRVVAVALPLP
ncbi:MAG: PQQ-binding-like beta-propeller repeat protein, partial [Thermoanaerobaculia bacterium]